MRAPTPATPLLRLSVNGPFPPLLPFEVHSNVSPEGIPGPAQLHAPGEVGQTTDSRLLEPARLTETLMPPSELVLKLCPSTVAFGPNRDHGTESFGACEACEDTWDIESADAEALESSSSAKRPIKA